MVYLLVTTYDTTITGEKKMSSSEHKEFRIFGPPGCGKTTYLEKQVQNAVQKHGSESIFIASYTKTAAAELAGRDMPIDAERCGTLHSHCYHALGRPTVAESKIKEFNMENPSFSISGGGSVDMNESALDQQYETQNDETFARYQILRNRMIPRELWPESVRVFAAKWEGWKQANNYIDFTDMIENATRYIERPPYSSSIGIFDEVQDFTPLQLQLIRQWGNKLEYFLLAGDDDQTLYTFTGATPDAFLHPELPETQKKILSQSWRVPAVVQSLAQKWIRQVKKRQEKEYKPRPYEGELKMSNATYKIPHPMIAEMNAYISQGKSVMVLASCGYMLQPLINMLREEGIPFHNPYRINRGDWNPLGNKRGYSTKDRILGFLNPTGPTFGDVTLWSVRELAGWVEICQTKGMLVTGGKKNIIEALANEVEDYNQILDIYKRNFKPDALNEAIMLSPTFIKDRITSTKAKTAGYVFKVLERQGMDALSGRPGICVGTIHSVKGGQADVVFLFPDLSMNGQKAYVDVGTEGYDSVIRQFYVGITRCRETLVVCQPSSSWAVKGINW